MGDVEKASESWVIKILDVTQSGSQTVNTWIATVGNCFSFLVIFIVVADVLGRFFLSKPFPATMELSESMLVYLVYFGLTLTHIKKGHANIRIFSDRLSYKGKKWIGLFNNVLIFLTFSLISWQAFLHAMASWKYREVYFAYPVPIYSAKFAIFVGCALLSFQVLLNILKELSGNHHRE